MGFPRSSFTAFLRVHTGLHPDLLSGLEWHQLAAAIRELEIQGVVAQHIHNVIGVPMHHRLLTRLEANVKHPHAVVFHNELVNIPGYNYRVRNSILFFSANTVKPPLGLIGPTIESTLPSNTTANTPKPHPSTGEYLSPPLGGDVKGRYPGNIMPVVIYCTFRFDKKRNL